MAPNTDSNTKTRFSHRKYPEYRSGTFKSPQDWLVGRQQDDNAEGLWRVHDDLYDLTDWLNVHPGGSEWLLQTKGTDITEAFEAHHLTDLAQHMLPKFHIRHVDTSRNSTFTFKDDGFYRTLKRRVIQELKKVPKSYTRRSKLMLDGLVFFTFFFSIVAVKTQSWLPLIAASWCLTWTTNAAHNFFHQKDNWRMYAFNLSLMTVRDWRVYHVLSHHLHPNTLADLETSSLEPLMKFLPTEKGPFPYTAWLATPFVYVTLYFVQFITNVLYVMRTKKFLAQFLIPLILPTVMYLVGRGDVVTTLSTWLYIIIVSSFIFGCIGLNAAHHHPKIFHDGDTLREDRDWGKFQLDAVMDRYIITASRFLVLTHYGDHALHHLFPTVDHSLLPFLYPVVREVCEEFGMKLRFVTIPQMILGHFRQMINSTPNPEPPNCKLD